MAVAPNNDNPPQDPPKDPNPDPNAGGGEGGEGEGESAKDSFKAFLEKKNFKSEDDAIKYFNDLESNNSKLAQERDQYQKYYPYALAFSSYLKSNEDAMKNYKKWSEGQSDDDDSGADDGGSDKNVPPKDDEARRDISNLLGLERDRAVSTFDQKYGLSQLPNEEYRKMADQMGSTLRSWGIDLRRPTSEMVNRLPKALEDAYAVYQVNAAKEKGGPVNFPLGGQDDRGRVPGIPSRGIDVSPDDVTEQTLSSDEKKAAEKMGLTPKEYAESKKEIIQASS